MLAPQRNARQQVIARLLETLRQDDPTQRQQALAEPGKMGEAEEF
ncbi:MAG: hypothetical protein P8Y03_19175 [Anaerolineales bacterium]|jgi:hypothetical protein